MPYTFTFSSELIAQHNMALKSYQRIYDSDEGEPELGGPSLRLGPKWESWAKSQENGHNPQKLNSSAYLIASAAYNFAYFIELPSVLDTMTLLSPGLAQCKCKVPRSQQFC